MQALAQACPGTLAAMRPLQHDGDALTALILGDRRAWATEEEVMLLHRAAATFVHAWVASSVHSNNKRVLRRR